MIGDCVKRLGTGQAVVLSRGYQNTFFGEGALLNIDFAAVCGGDNLLYGQAILERELVVPVIMAGHRHQCASAILHEHEVGDVNGNLFLRQRMNGLVTGIDAFLFHGCHIGFGNLAVTALLDKFSNLAIALGSGLGNGVLGGHGHVSHAHERVRAGGVDVQRVLAAFEGEGQLGTHGFANPVTLHGLDLLRPVLQLVQIIQQFFGVVGNADKPLGNLFLLDQRAGAPAATINHLFIGQHRLVDWVPVDGGHLLVHQAFS